MATETANFLHLARPVVPTQAGLNISSSPVTVNIQSQAVLSILDHALRRDIDNNQTTRGIGALVGSRSEDGSEVEVRSTFAIPHKENADQVEMDLEYQKHMLALTLKASPRDSLLGWYTTSHELNSFSALIQNFFSSPETGTAPHPAVHLTMSTDPAADIETRCYISAPVAVNAERAAESCMFIRVPHKVLTSEAEQSALEAISGAKDSDTRTAPLVSDIEGLSRSLETTLDHLSRVSEWVSGVLDEEEEPNTSIGQFLMNSLSLTPKVSAEQIDRDFNNHIQDVLMVSYLANTIRTQIELSQRLGVWSSSATEKDGEGKADSENAKSGDKRHNNKRHNNQRHNNSNNNNSNSNNNNRGNREQREPREPREPRESAE
ncbi:Eukaryotic translation initiation factor 3 subunit F [Ceratocystis lukuohia]|uniref:Eukaryotic translation initiation factor 3 subunit F n=3 Tax=Ceratocystis TaxID=5157 RepID=A0A0F8BX15_CERFI|nr:Eukaryotic translation initiation factor 3 subunit F [Ceratocystis platani]PHH49499.1 Eukaryotic translation initiation factor 3 subunit F [Ceratocystis fimbriata CBS 114723]